MTQAYWAMRFYLPFEEDKNIQFIGSFEEAGKRYLDDVVVFSGMYGIPDYALWYIHKDLVSYDFSSFSFELKLYLDGNKENCYFTDKYRIVDVGDDLSSDRKLLYAIQEDYAKLETLLIELRITVLDYDEKRTTEDLLIEVLEETGIFPVIFCEHNDPILQSIKFEYPTFTLDPRWTIRDFIQYIANENNFEWTIKHGILFIGPELPAYEDMLSSRDVLDREVDNVSKNYWNMKITWAATPLNVFYYYKHTEDERITDMRCIWAKHWVGNNGDTTKGMFVPIGTQVNKKIYLESLEGDKEINNAYYLSLNPKYDETIVGRITKDEGDNKFADEITLQKEVKQWPIKNPRNMIMNTQNSLFTMPKIGRTTPYLDHNAGLLFPRSFDLSKNPNQLIFSPYGRIEQSILGPFVMGNGDKNFKIPVKNKDDFRFILPNGWDIYISNDNEFIITFVDSDPESIPQKDDDAIQLYIDPATDYLKINKGNGNYIEIEGDKLRVFSKGDMTINSSGKVDINGSGEITVDGTETKIQGGASALAHANHTHGMSSHMHLVTPGALIPGPPVTTAAPLTPNTEACTSNTTKTKAD